MENNKQKILIVDDEVEIVKALGDFFKLKGYEAKSAYSGEEALTILEQASVDLVLLDIRMQGMWGNEVAKVIKAKYPKVKVIILTAFPEEQIRLDQDLNVDGFFIKPVRFQELYNKLLNLTRQDEVPQATTEKQMKARVFLIKARLLLLEPEPETFKNLSQHFKNLIRNGENYDLELAGNDGEVLQKLNEFKPDILILNQAYLNKLDVDFVEKIGRGAYKPKEIAFYNLPAPGNLPPAELEKLTKTIQAFCFKNGLMDIKWIKI